ncbi:MAG: transcription antiterminator [Clostridiaceae bacterium]
MNKKNVKNKITKLLIQNDKPITVNELASVYSLSGKTIRNYLNELEDELKDSGIKMIKKPGVGVFLEAKDEKSLSELKRNVAFNNVNNQIYSPGYRKSYILKILFESTTPYTIALFAEELYVSKGTIMNDLIEAQIFIENHNLVLKRKQNQGLWIEGSEENYRKAMMDLFFEFKNNDNVKIDEEDIDNLDYRISFENYLKIKHLMPKISYFKIQSIVQQAEEKLGYYFTDLAFMNLIIHIAITIERVKHNKQISMTSDFYTNINKNEFEFEIAKWIVKGLEKELNIKFPDVEIAFISLHILGSKIQQGITANDYEILMDKENEIYREMAEEIVSLVSEILKVDLTKDRLLKVSLIMHLRPTIIKLKYGLNIKNPILERIKNEYTSIFASVWACNSIFERRIGFPINENEVGYIALHFAVALDRINNKIKVIVVCSSGVGTSQLVASRLNKKLKEVDIISILPAGKIDNDLLKKCDLLITTIPLTNIDKPSIRVSTLIDELDILNIEKKIEQIKFIDNVYTEESSEVEIIEDEDELMSLFDENLCFIDEERDKFEDIINYYGDILEKKSFVKNGFSKNVLHREKIASTYIGKGISIPHSTEEYVNESKVCIVKLKNSIKNINLIVILALKFKDIKLTKNFFKNFYAVLDDDKVTSKINKAKDKYEILSIFINGGK